MRADPTPEEHLAFSIVARELGVVLDTTRERTAPNQVDAVLKPSASGAAFAALEVTMLCDQQEVQTERLLSRDRHRWRFPELTWWWSVSMPYDVRLNKARTQLPVALQFFEHNGISQPAANPCGPSPRDPALKWFLEAGIWAHGHADVVADDPNHVRAPGSVTITGPPRGGFAGGLNKIPPWVSGELRSSTLLRSKVEKLERAGFAEQHLFLFVDFSGAPFSVVDPLAAERGVPDLAPDLGSITHLWLFPTFPFSQTILVWQREKWSRVPIPALAPTPPAASAPG